MLVDELEPDELVSVEVLLGPVELVLGLELRAPLRTPLNSTSATAEATTRSTAMPRAMALVETNRIFPCHQMILAYWARLFAKAA
jgi:hypothetical protein